MTGWSCRFGLNSLGWAEEDLVFWAGPRVANVVRIRLN